MSAGTPEFQANTVHPSNPEFYSGSITQVLNNPNLNPALTAQNSNQGHAQSTYPNSHVSSIAEANKLGNTANNQEVQKQSEAKEEEDEEVICTTKPLNSPAAHLSKDPSQPLLRPTLAQQVSVGDINSTPADMQTSVNSSQAMHSQMQQVPVIERPEMIKTKSWKDLTKEEDEDFE